MAPDDDWTRAILGRALMRGRFTLRSGATSDRYFDKFRIFCDPKLLASTGARLASLRDEVAPESSCIVAPELGAVPIAAALALRAELPYVIVRTTSKSYGTSRRIEGTTTSGAHAVLLEDVVTSGSAALEALDIARNAGLVITTALCVLDRDGGGREALRDQGVTLHSLLDSNMLDEAFDAGIGEHVTTDGGTGR